MIILNEYTVTYSTLTPGLEFLGVILTFIGITVLICGTLYSIECCNLGYFFGSLLCSFLFFAVAITIFYSSDSEYTRYEVLLDDNVSFNELYSQYDIIEQRGQIYVIQERR